MPDPASQNPADSAALTPGTSKQVVLPMNVNLPETIASDLPPLVTKIAIPQAFFVATVRPQ